MLTVLIECSNKPEEKFPGHWLGYKADRAFKGVLRPREITRGPRSRALLHEILYFGKDSQTFTMQINSPYFCVGYFGVRLRGISEHEVKEKFEYGE